MAIPITTDGNLSLEKQQALIQETERRMFVRLESIAPNVDSNLPFNQIMLRIVDPDTNEPVTALQLVADGVGHVVWHGQMYVSGSLAHVSAVR